MRIYPGPRVKAGKNRYMMIHLVLTGAAIGCALLAGVESRASGTTGSDAVEYNRVIRPILAENCFACHGPDSASRKAGLRLDSFEDAIATTKEGKHAIVPGKPGESELIRRIQTTDEDDLMPPPKTKKHLTQQQKDLLRNWIAAGAKYQPHWSLIPPQRPPLPSVKAKSWVRNPIDAFVLNRLENAGLAPSPEADRRTLARRLSLDLTGLPPSPDLVRSFEKDSSPNAYQTLVDQLFRSPHYGEHRARYWLDAARYADTHGIHIDNFREIWSYRDWVIHAFNSNMPFDRFTIEQLAGDLLPNPAMEQRIATGFNRCNTTTSEGGAIADEYLVLYTRDRTETTSQVWLGMTAGCAVCHDHKFDRLTQREFYEMSAFFNNTTQPAMDGNKKDTPPIIVVPKGQDLARWDQLPPEKKAAQERIERRRESAQPDYQQWLTQAQPALFLDRVPTASLLLRVPLTENNASEIEATGPGVPARISLATNSCSQDGIIAEKAFVTGKETVPVLPEAGNFERDQPFSVALWIWLPPEAKQGSIVARMDPDDAYRGWDVWFDNAKPGMHLVHNWPEDALKVISKKALEPKRWTHVCVTYDGSSKADGVKIYINGEAQAVDRPNNKLQHTIATKVPFKIGQRHRGDAVEKAGVQDLRLYGKILGKDEITAIKDHPRTAYIVGKTPDTRSDDDKKALYDSYLAQFDSEYRLASSGLTRLEQEESDIKARGTIAHVMQEKTNAPSAYVLFRGEYNKQRDKVSPGTPKALPPMPAGFPANRLGFARWLLLPDQPLTARVTVNRFWQELFGTGLVKTAGDFGVMGDLPSHPELLDWLAVEFRESGWDIQHIYRLMVTSATYRQAAMVTSEKLAKDPQNRLLSRGPRFRLDAEVIRDQALAASGLLTRKFGGPSVRPYQPEGVWEMVAMRESDTRNYKADADENLYRRSLYTFWKRTAPPASMEIMNAPSRETCTVRREQTDTPLQALATLNDVQFVEAARRLAEKALLEAQHSNKARLDFMAWRLLSRPLRAPEQKIARQVLESLLAHYRSAPEEAQALIKVGESKSDASLEPVQLAAYTMMANQFMNLDEVLNK